MLNQIIPIFLVDYTYEYLDYARLLYSGYFYSFITNTEIIFIFFLNTVYKRIQCLKEKHKKREFNVNPRNAQPTNTVVVLQKNAVV
jgi:predicted permease